MTEQSEGAKAKTARRSDAANLKARDDAAKKVAEARQTIGDALQAQHDAKVALQNARFAELGERMETSAALGELGVTVKK